MTSEEERLYGLLLNACDWILSFMHLPSNVERDRAWAREQIIKMLELDPPDWQSGRQKYDEYRVANPLKSER